MAEAQQGNDNTEEDATELQFPKGVAGEAGMVERSKASVIESEASMVRGGDRFHVGKAGVLERTGVIKTVMSERTVGVDKASELEKGGVENKTDLVDSCQKGTEGIVGCQEVHCDHCGAKVQGAYICCGECVDVYVCLRCFSRGAEFENHRSDHSYWVAQSKIGVLEEGWEAREELGLLDALASCGLGNWEEVSRRLPGRTPDQCRAHYNRCYLTPSHPALADVLDSPSLQPRSPPEPVEYQGGGEDPPRPLPGSALARDLAGYNPARGDFETETESEAEAIVSDLDTNLFHSDPPDTLGPVIQATLLDIYRHRLAHRHSRKHIIREHGLMAQSKTGMLMARHRQYLPRDFADVLPRIMPLLTAFNLDMLLEGLHYESELKRQIMDLMEWRGAGLTRHRGALTYETLRRRREVARRERRNLVVAQDGVGWEQWSVLPSNMTHPTVTSATPNRRISQPLNISGMPGYNTLSEAERLLCSELRLLPEDFKRFKIFFVEECKKAGGLRLAQARTLIKIDVNKIRKIYDYLLDQGLIHPPHKK
ncbi:hypothetical protein Pcinc_024565 [Petrolisthes cinctipes]|uniref:Transcriptional adapter n=1 Tax=Petrolisthes cinctipes TaxID=88211 RepID=A0AAE1FAC6_PETCI|nr:hypothetical protein Pcinc_024565 [Petrolisthes cinctipes]